MITPDRHKRRKELDEFVMTSQRAGKIYGQFWDNFGQACDAQARIKDAHQDIGDQTSNGPRGGAALANACASGQNSYEHSIPGDHEDSCLP